MMAQGGHHQWYWYRGKSFTSVTDKWQVDSWRSTVKKTLAGHVISRGKSWLVDGVLQPHNLRQADTIYLGIFAYSLVL
jgi:hypothetical protein